MKKSLVVILMLALGFPVYAKQKHRKKAKGNDIVSVQMHRSACYGRCPDYTVDVNKNGTVTYTGVMFVKDSGTYRKNIGAQKTAEVLSQFAAYRVDTCSESYLNRIPDLPGLYYTITYKNKTKKINNASFGPLFLKTLAAKMDSVAQVDNTWQKGIAVKPQ